MGYIVKNLAERLSLPGVATETVCINAKEVLERYKGEWSVVVSEKTCNDILQDQANRPLAMPTIEDRGAVLSKKTACTSYLVL
jgi:hypothetical protein